MKNSLILLGSVCLFVASTLKAQDEYPRENVQLGLKAGMNFSNVWDEQGQDFEANTKAGFAGGVFLGIPITKYLGLQPEVLVSQKGFQGSGTLLGTPYSFSRTTTFLDIPLQLQVKPAKYVTLLAGPQYSFLLHQKDLYTFGANSSEQESEFENDNIRKNILGFVVGADFILQHVVLSGRFGWDFQANNGEGAYITPRYKNQWLQFTVGFKL
jgi:hypothetical protein